MRWFKHFTDAHEGKSLMQLFDLTGHTGIACYWILVEMCAAKIDEIMEAKGDERLTEEDMEFVFHARKLRERFRLSQTGVRRVLDASSTLTLVKVEYGSDLVKIKMPKLLKCLERAKKKDVRTTSERRQVDVLDIDIDIDKDLLLEKEKATEPEKPARVRKPRKAFEPNSEAELWLAISDETKAAWIKLYPDEKFRERQLTRCFAYYSQRPQKKPKTLTGWIGKLDFWFVNDWERRSKFNAAETNKNAPPAIRYPDASTLPKPPPPEEREGGPEAAAKVRELLRKSFGPKMEGA